LVVQRVEQKDDHEEYMTDVMLVVPMDAWMVVLSVVSKVVYSVDWKVCL